MWRHIGNLIGREGGRDKWVTPGDKTKRLNLRITGMIPTAKPWHSAERQLRDMLSRRHRGESAWKVICDRLQRPRYLNRVGHDRKIRNTKRSIYIGKYSFVRMIIQLWNQLPADALGALSCKPSNFRNSEVKWSEVKWNVNCGKGGNNFKGRWEGCVRTVKWSEGKVVAKFESNALARDITCSVVVTVYWKVSLTFINCTI
jgi:hypothetical protein